MAEYSIDQVLASQKKVTNDLIAVTMKICLNIENNEEISEDDLELQKSLDGQKKIYDRIVTSMNKEMKNNNSNPFTEISKQLSEIKSAMPQIQRKTVE